MEKVPKLNYGDKYKVTSFNNHKNELINAIKNSGMELDKSNNKQFYEAIYKHKKNYDVYCIDSGSKGSYVLPASYGEVNSYAAGLKLIFKPLSAPKANSTLKLGSLNAKPAVIAYDASEYDRDFTPNNLFAAYYEPDKDIFLLRDNSEQEFIVSSDNTSFTRHMPELSISGGFATLKLVTSIIYPTMILQDFSIAGSSTAPFANDLIVTNKNNKTLSKAKIIKGSNVTTSTFEAGKNYWCGTFIKPDLFYLYSFVKG